MKKLFTLNLLALAALAIFGTANIATASEEDMDNDVAIESMDSENAEAAHYYHPPYPYPPYPYPPYPTTPVVCYARNGRGQLFSAVGYDTYMTQQAALARCAGFVCVAAGCQAYYGPVGPGPVYP